MFQRSERASDVVGDGNRFLSESAARSSTGALELWVLAERADVPVGFMGLAEHDIAALFLEPAHRGQGAGRRLVTHAQQLRGGSLTVDVNEQNPAARGFYEALGFVVVSRSPLDGDGRPFPLLHMRRPAPPNEIDALCRLSGAHAA